MGYSREKQRLLARLQGAVIQPISRDYQVVILAGGDHLSMINLCEVFFDITIFNIACATQKGERLLSLRETSPCPLPQPGHRRSGKF